MASLIRRGSIILNSKLSRRILKANIHFTLSLLAIIVLLPRFEIHWERINWKPNCFYFSVVHVADLFAFQFSSSAFAISGVSIGTKVRAIGRKQFSNAHSFFFPSPPLLHQSSLTAPLTLLFLPKSIYFNKG
jgi:hypothetical protein